MPDLGRDIVRFVPGASIQIGDRALEWVSPPRFPFAWAFDPETLILYVHEQTRSAYEAWRAAQHARETGT